MAAVSEYLFGNVDFSSVNKHAVSFSKLLFNANFRSIHCWRKEEITNKREDMDYDVIRSLPEEVRTWICRERAKHIRHFALEVCTDEPREKPVKYNATIWMDKFRKMFTTARGELYKKTLKVRTKNINLYNGKH